MSNKISNERKTMYYIGLGLTVLGGILFISSFFTAFNDFNNPGIDLGMPSFFLRALIGMICMIVGSILMNVGAKGKAGSGLLLDPDKAREDLKPFSSAKGKMINDMAEEVDFLKNKGEKSPQEEKIKIRCRECRGLNDEDAKFCKNCGERL